MSAWSDEDRRELWRLENFLAVNSTNQSQRDRRLSLYRYLCDTCEHEWMDVMGWGGSPRGTRQCSWCNAVLAPGERLAPADRSPLPEERTHRAWQERQAARVIPPTSEAAS